MEKIILECCICRQWRSDSVREDGDPSYKGGKFYTPTPEERRTAYFSGVKLSHGYCPLCAAENLRRAGVPQSKIEDFLKGLK